MKSTYNLETLASTMLDLDLITIIHDPRANNREVYFNDGSSFVKSLGFYGPNLPHHDEAYNRVNFWGTAKAKDDTPSGNYASELSAIGGVIRNALCDR